MNGEENFTIEKVCEVVAVPPHVIRYWEFEFSQLESKKDESRQRVYNQKDLDVIIRIYKLLFENSYTIADTKTELAEEFG